MGREALGRALTNYIYYYMEFMVGVEGRAFGRAALH